MALHISSEALREAGLDERDALIEFACRMFQSKRLALWPAAKLANLSRVEMEGELRRRQIPVYSPTLQDVYEDLQSLKKIGA